MRAECVIQTMTSDIAHMGRTQAQHNQMVAAEVREDMFRAQEIIALKHMMTQFESEASEEVQVRDSNFRGEARDMIDEIRNE